MQLLRDVYLLSGHAYGMHPNVYGVALPEGGMALVDTGLDDEDLGVVRRVMERWGLKLPITHVLVTHAHFDHSGNVRYFADRGAAVYAGQSEAEGMRLGDARTIPYAYSRPFPACEGVIPVGDGERLNCGGLGFLCRSAPGHSPGSMVYELSLEGRTVWFTGDFIMASPDCGEGVCGVAVGEDYDADAYLASLRRFCSLKADVILGGHGHPALQNADELIHSAYRNKLVGRITQ